MSLAEFQTIQPDRKRHWTLSLRWIVILAVLSGAAAYAYSRSPDSSKAQQSPGGGKQRPGSKYGHNGDEAVPVSVESALQGDFPVYLGGLGTVTGLRTVTVRSRVDGELVRVAYTEGQLVNQGDLLAEIDPRAFQVQLQQALGQLQRDQALLKNAEIDVARYQTLQEQDSIAAQQTMTQEALVKQYRGVVEMDNALVANAKLQLDYAKLKAPISGRVGLRLIDQGNIIHANDTNGVVVITQTQPIAVVFTLPEDKLPMVVKRWHSKALIKVEAFDRAGKVKLADGTILAMDNQIDPGTGTVKLKAQFDNKDQNLFSNQFVNIKMHLDTLAGATVVSSAAIQNDAQGAFVYVVQPDNTAQIRRVALGPTEADKVVVLNNLAAGEAVVVDGIDRLREGSKVDIAKKDGQAVAASQKVEGKIGEDFHKSDRRS
ncbi:MAG: MdtA/MuxA family multidrug efflux RND transporter periplasmic adaptor subunit [Methylococcales bacterium]|nr:MdtA/MuxA family multidrug efflux RND transporter periplasmic adaptor subunit [Methylococcales bacterium]